MMIFPGLQLYTGNEDPCLRVRRLSIGCPILDEFLMGKVPEF